jgi:hypothetical protein
MLWADVITGHGAKKPNYSTVYTGTIRLYLHLYKTYVSSKVVEDVKS